MIKEKIISALIGTLFFAVFQPLGLHTFGWMRWFYIAGIGFMAISLCVLSEILLRYVFRMPTDVKRSPSYMMRRGIVYQVCNISLLSIAITFYYAHFINNSQVSNPLSWNLYFKLLLCLLCVSLIIGLYWRNVYMKRYYFKQLEDAQLLNGVLLERSRNAKNTEPQMPDDSPTVLLEGTTKESLSLCMANLLYATSEGNYVSVHYLEGDEEKQTMLRTSMKSVATILCTNPSVMQCHRAFLVNLLHVKSVEGRSSGIGLKLHHCSLVVPVSKGYVNDVKERIKNPVR